METAEPEPTRGDATRSAPEPAREARDMGSTVAAPFLHVRLCVLIFLAFAVMGAWLPVFSLHLQALEFTPTATAWASAANAIGAMLAPLIWGQIADRWLAKERCICLCAVVTACGLWVLAELREPLAVIVLSIAIWFFLIPVIGLTGAFIFRQLEHPDRDYGKIRLWGTLGWIAANWALTAWFTFAPAFIPFHTVELADSLRLAGLAAVAVAVFALTMPHAPPHRGTHDADTARSLLARIADAPLRAARLLRRRSFFVYCACMFGFYVTVPFTIQLNPLLLSRIGIGARNVPLCLTACQSMEVILLALLPMLLLRLGSKMTMVMGAFAWVLGLCALAVGQSAALVLPGLATGGVFICCFVIAGQVFVNSQATPDIRASAQGLLVFINGTGLLIGHFLVGMIRAATEDRFDLAYLIAAILSAVLCVLFTAGFTSLNAPKTAPDTLVADSEMA